MNKNLLTISLSALLACGSAYAVNPLSPESFASYVQGISDKAHNPGRHCWSARSASDSSVRRIITKTDGQTAPVSSWGSVYTPDGIEMLYSTEFTAKQTNGDYTITAADITLYNPDMSVYKTFRAEFTLGEHDTTVNSVQVSPFLTKKFFNINDDYEVMVYVHATTDDYSGRSYTQVYTLKDGSYITAIAGDCINATNTALDPWSENYHLVFMREDLEIIPAASDDEYDQYNYTILFDVYSKAGWSTESKLEHTFNVDYALFAGAGNYALPILVQKHNNRIYYALPRYEKPYFESQMTEDITPDNHFIIDLYDQDFNLVKTTSIPMELEGAAIFSFPGLGLLSGNNDVDFEHFSDGNLPCYVVGMENYITSYDDFNTSIHIYDADGNLLKTMVENAEDYRTMASVKGYEDQYCFYYSDEDPHFSMINYPSCTEATRIPLALGDTSISMELDRVPLSGSYKYVSSLLYAETDDKGNALHSIAWFNADGSFDEFHTINLGKNIALAMPNIASYALDPFIFNTDEKIEYMFLVKEIVDPTVSSRSREVLRIYNQDSDLLLTLGPNEETGEALNSIFMINLDSNDPKMIVSYYGNEGYTIHHVDLPLSKFSGGSGTMFDPYMIAAPGDLMSISYSPGAYYKLANDIDFEGMSWSGNKCSFTGVLDGNGFTISNMTLLNGGIFSEMSGTVRNINFKDITLEVNNGEYAGLIASYILASTNSPLIYNINVNGMSVRGNANGYIGGLVGTSAISPIISRCSIVNADFDAPHASVGGFVGRAATGTNVNVCYFDGKISANVAGGIIATSITGDEVVNNCHVKADIVGSQIAGGIVGESHRTIVNNCLAEGTVAAIGSRQAYAGGLVGYMSAIYEAPKYNPIENNIVAVKSVTANTDAKEHIAHRVLGFSSGDEMLVDWETKDPSFNPNDPSTYIYIKGSPEVALANNYALNLAIIDTKAEDAANSVEGLSITEADLTDSFFSNLGYLFGDNDNNPWSKGGDVIRLYYVTDASGIGSVFAPVAGITFDGSNINAAGTIVIYDLAGNVVARGTNKIDTTSYSKGTMYIAVCNGVALKFIAR